jgi:hypothetical protein
MSKKIDLLAHLKGSEARVKDWPKWKRDIWPDSSIPPVTSTSENKPIHVKGEVFLELMNFSRHK